MGRVTAYKMAEWEALGLSPSIEATIELEKAIAINSLGTLETGHLQRAGVCLMKGEAAYVH